ncbi:uncharacterized protein LOC106639113 [Copidosoma floridanum]|uniref:uncharacterized protein LOC106639113 n=1 Tax=Copidosoma floridanum TaxID=29053 RepID=UPI0006C96C29|nr:uncharacterized protein LOC106639113 [Copidosoma floridanum]
MVTQDEKLIDLKYRHLLVSYDIPAETLLEGFGYLYQAYEFVSTNFGNFEVTPSAEELHYQSLRSDLRDLKMDLEKMEHNLPTEVNINNRLQEVRMKFIDIDGDYDKYIKYKKNPSRYEPQTLSEYAEKMTNELPRTLDRIYKDVIKNNLVNLIEQYINNVDPYCEKTQSRQRYFYDFFRTILSYEIKGIVILEYAYKMKYENSTHVSHVQEKQDWKEHASEIIRDTMKEFKTIISRTERDMWRCDPTTPTENKNFVELKLFQRVLYHGWDFTSTSGSKPSELDSCPVPQKDKGVAPICEFSCSSKQRRCSNVVNCTALEYKKPIVACILKDQSQRRRYSSVNETHKYMDEFSLTQKISPPSYCDKHSERRVFESSLVTVRLTSINYIACDCICNELTNSDRYISLEPVIADVEENFVVTGVKFVLVNHTLHIQIQQGKLKQYGSINKESLKWKDIETVTEYADEIITFTPDDKEKYKTRDTYKGKKTFKLDWYDKRGLYLDDMDLKKNEVVAGVRFGLVRQKNNFIYVKLDIMAMEFNYNKGQLNSREYYWWSLKQRSLDRTHLNLEEYDTPTLLENIKNKPDGVAHKYAKFTPSAYSSKDAGQSTLPFIDIQPVVSDPPVPLSGISMDIKRADKSGGYLILKTKTYDVLWEFNTTTEQLEF